MLKRITFALMNRISKIGLFGAASLAMLFGACLPNNNFPDEPVVEFKEFKKIPTSDGKDEKGVLVLKFTDGDGDIGLDQGDTLPPHDPSSIYYYNFFTRYYEKQNGEFVEVELGTPNYFRIPVLTPVGQNKSLEGEIEVELYINNPFSDYDTIKFDAWIVDQALHESNTVETGEIIIVK